jgi:hypothetical protein
MTALIAGSSGLLYVTVFALVVVVLTGLGLRWELWVRS